MRELCPLTARQHEILMLVSQGLTQKQIALRLGLSANTVRTHLHLAYQRLDVANAAQAVVVLIENDWHEEDCDVPLPSPGLRERLGLDRPASWWRQDTPILRLLDHIAHVPPNPSSGYRVIPPSRPREQAADQLASTVPRIRLTPDQPEEKAA